MELHLNEHYSFWDLIVEAGKSFIQPFLEPDKSEQHLISFIMPITELKNAIHQHYVSNKPLMITYEYYDENHQYHRITESCTIHSTISQHQQVAVQFHQTEYPQLLHLDQIVRVQPTT